MVTPFLSRAQNLEDIVLWRALSGVRDGRYIDIGAADPRTFSVSRGFYEQGWRGAHFEPHPTSADRLRADRPDEPVHAVALSDRTETIEFSLSPIAGNSTGVPALATASARTIQVPSRTLASYGRWWSGADVHWMKVDVEGMEAHVLRGWDSTVLRPWILVIEATMPNSTEPSQDAWEPIVLAAGYRFALFDGLNRFYVAEERGDLLPVVSAPANIMDLYRGGIRLTGWREFLEPVPIRRGPLATLRARVARVFGRGAA